MESAKDPRLQDFPLLPCPKCGSKAKWIRPMGNSLRTRVPPYYGVSLFRVCCSAQIDYCGASVFGLAEVSPVLAAMAWNKRKG